MILKEMLETLQGEKISELDVGDDSKKTSKGITVVIDAGIATEENVELLKGAGYDYICVVRNKNDLLTIKEDRDNKVEV